VEKLRIAVVIKQGYKPTEGGGFSYYDRLINAIDLFSFNNNLEFFFLNLDYEMSYAFKKKTITFSFEAVKNKNKHIISLRALIRFYSLPLLRCLKVKNRLALRLKKFVIDETEALLKANKIDLLYYLTPEYVAEPISYNYPYIITHWDLGHKSTFAFPEVSMNREYEKRDQYHRDILKRAFAIFAESDAGKQELTCYERINPDRIFVVPMFAGKVVELTVAAKEQEIVLNKYGLKQKEFFFYPAQFWGHKNHFNLFKAFRKFVDQHAEVKLVLTGSDKGNLEYLKQLTVDLVLENSIIFTGFASEKEIYTFYKNASSLVMPTFLGPTNIPLLEAQQIGCPVICSHFDGHKEMLNEKALYFDPVDYIDIYKCMKQIRDQYDEYSQPLVNLKFNITHSLETINKNLLWLYPIRKSFGLNFE
jgi:glycosyltransferase involved in cell wall biosynthesis